MPMSQSADAVREAVRGVPVIDAHTHVIEEHPGARGLDDILLYHMAISELYAAGAPNPRRLTEFPGTPAEVERVERLSAAVPYLRHVRNTSTSWGVRVLLRDLYDWTDEVTEENWPRLHDIVRERSRESSWAGEVLSRGGIERVGTEYARRGRERKPVFFYSLEWAFFTRSTWGAFDTPLVELERTVGAKPESPAPIAAADETAELPPRLTSVGEVEDAVRGYVDALPPAGVIRSMATHISVDIDLRPVPAPQFKAALARRDQAGEEEQSVYASYIHEALLAELAARRPDIIFQFSYGAEPLPYETGSRVTDRSIRQIGEMIARHPGIHFQCFLASRHANQSLCTLCRELPNFSLVGYWWHNFFPTVICDVIDERLDMLPTNRFVGFFSDAYCVEWSYAKSIIVRRLLADALGLRIDRGQLDLSEAVQVAKRILHDTPFEMYKLGEAMPASSGERE